jgi:hypothetical protein
MLYYYIKQGGRHYANVEFRYSQTSGASAGLSMYKGTDLGGAPSRSRRFARLSDGRCQHWPRQAIKLWQLKVLPPSNVLPKSAIGPNRRLPQRSA